MKIKNMKLMLLGLLAMGSMNAFAWSVGDDLNQVFSVNGITYEVTTGYQPAVGVTPAQNGKVTIIEYSATTTTDAVVIPETVQNQTQSLVDKVPTEYVYDVFAIADYAVGTAEVFKGAKAASITLPANLQSIGANAFEGAEAASIVIPAYSKLTTIGNSAFKGCANLATFATGNAKYIQNIGAHAFEGCAKLTAITLTDELNTIGDDAFKGTGIVTLDLSACKNFTTANGAAVNRWFTDDATDPKTYNTNSTLTTVKLPTALAATSDALTIAENAFKGCTALTQVGASAGAVIPAYINTIGNNAFANTGITKLDLSASALAEVGTWFSVKPTSGKDLSKLEQVILKSDVTYTSLSGLTKITTLKKVGIPGAEYALPKNASAVVTDGIFAGTALEQLDLSKITAITNLPALFGTTADTPYPSLTAVVLNDKTTDLAENAFARCENLASLTVKDKDGKAKDLTVIKSVGNGAFYRTALSSLTFGAALTTLTTPFNGDDKEADGTTPKARSTAESISIDLSKAGLTSIEANTFQKVAALTSVKLPTAATFVSIGANAFEGTGITAIEIPAGVDGSSTNLIGNNAFKECKSLKTVTYNTTGTTEICKSIDGDNNVFKGCNLVTIYASADYVAGKAAPTNAVYSKLASKNIVTALDKKSGSYAMKGFYDQTQDYRVKAEDVDAIYEAYLDGENIVMSRLRVRNGYINIPMDHAVIVKTTEAKEITPEKMTIDTSNSTLTKDDDSSSLLDTDNALKSVAADNTDKPEANYIYALTNRAGKGFEFTFYTGSKFNNGNIYIVSPRVPSASGRLNIIWLDENGNVENVDEATAIQSIETVANDAVIYNMAGQQVDANYKGVVIKNGKKMIQK